jgi:CRP-like cAMP-binding protein
MNPDPQRLATVPLFEGLDGGDLAKLATWFEVESFETGTPLIREGRVNYEFFVIDEGSVRVERDGAAVAVLGPGDVYGEMALIGGVQRAADAFADTDVRVLAMFGTEFREMQATMPTVAARLEDLAESRRAELGA